MKELQRFKKTTRTQINITTCKITCATEDSMQEYRKPEMTYL
jgi:hypothetical protein